MAFKVWIKKDKSINDYAIHVDIESASLLLQYLAKSYLEEKLDDVDRIKTLDFRNLLIREMRLEAEAKTNPREMWLKTNDLS